MLDRLTSKILHADSGACFEVRERRLLTPPAASRHIDFGDCFEVAVQREKFPEKIPFRLTRMLVAAMEVSGVEGTFCSASGGMRGTRPRHVRGMPHRHLPRDLHRRDGRAAPQQGLGDGDARGARARQSQAAPTTRPRHVGGVSQAFVHDPLINWRLLIRQVLWVSPVISPAHRHAGCAPRRPCSTRRSKRRRPRGARPRRRTHPPTSKPSSGPSRNPLGAFPHRRADPPSGAARRSERARAVRRRRSAREPVRVRRCDLRPAAPPAPSGGGLRSVCGQARRAAAVAAAAEEEEAEAEAAAAADAAVAASASEAAEAAVAASASAASAVRRERRRAAAAGR